MTLSKDDPVPESELAKYLLGTLPTVENEQFDELSVADDEFADRLCAVENDLVDAYVTGELQGEALSQFQSHYLSTEHRRDKVEMARILTAAEGRLKADHKTKSSILPMKAPDVIDQNPRYPHLRHAPAMSWRWAALAAIVLLSLSTTWLGFNNFRLRIQNRIGRATYGELRERFRQLQSQLETERVPQAKQSSSDDAKDLSGRTSDSTTALIGSIFLLPQRRGAAEIPTVSISGKTGFILLQLELESDEFRQYEVDVKDLASNQSVWRSEAVKSESSGRNPALSVLLPAGSVESRNYSAEVSGIGANGKTELLSGYVFKIAKTASH